MELFRHLDIETFSTCNRRCPTCIRNSHPNKEAVQDWFEPHAMPVEMVEDILEQARKMIFNGTVCLSHFNEPLMDVRLLEFCQISKSKGFHTYFHTNGDFLTSGMARMFDGNVDKIVFSLYMNEPAKSQRATWIKSLFSVTKAEVITQSDHVISHYSSDPRLQQRIEETSGFSCYEPRLHCIINHRGQYLACCEDVIGNFDLGSFPKVSLQEYWYGMKHTRMVESLKLPGGKQFHSYCSICPK